MKKILKNSFIYKKIKQYHLYILFYSDYKIFIKKDVHRRFKNEWKDKFPCLEDKTSTTPIDRHYVYHTAWAARKLKEISPKKHIDISSYIYFSTIASAFVPIKFYDFRPAPIVIDNFSSESADLTNLFMENNSIESISCLHTIEHIGLGRYGDPINPDGDIKAINELKRVERKEGHILFVVPVGKPKIMFNAHRIYSYQQIIELFNGFKLREFSLIPDNKNEGLITNATEEQANAQNYGCGCFWFIKL